MSIMSTNSTEAPNAGSKDFMLANHLIRVITVNVTVKQCLKSLANIKGCDKL
jgi:hypothetical protein